MLMSHILLVLITPATVIVIARVDLIFVFSRERIALRADLSSIIAVTVLDYARVCTTDGILLLSLPVFNIH